MTTTQTDYDLILVKDLLFARLAIVVDAESLQFSASHYRTGDIVEVHCIHLYATGNQSASCMAYAIPDRYRRSKLAARLVNIPLANLKPYKGTE